MPTSVARWVNEAKTPRGGFFGEVKSSAQGNEGEGYAPTRIDYAAGRARSDNLEGVGDEAEKAPVGLFRARSHENRKRKDGAVLLCAATIFSEGQGK